MLGDGLKGLVPVLVAKLAFMPPGEGFTVLTPTGVMMANASPSAGAFWLPIMATVFGVVMGHNYSFWMALIHKRFGRTGKGLATGAGALLAYDWRYFVAVVVVGLGVIAITRYMMAGQVAAAITLPVTALVLHSPDWPFALLMGLDRVRRPPQAVRRAASRPRAEALRRRRERAARLGRLAKPIEQRRQAPRRAVTPGTTKAGRMPGLREEL